MQQLSKHLFLQCNYGGGGYKTGWGGVKLAPVSDSYKIITGRLSFWGNYFMPTPVSLWRSDLEPMGVSDHCKTRSDDLLAIGSDREYGGGVM